MFDHGEVGYGEYRATQNGGSNNVNPALSLIVTIIGIGMAIPFVGFIGLFLFYSMGR